MNYISKIITIILGSLLSALLILLGLNFENTLFHWWPVYVDSIKPSDKFEVFRDLLLILLSALAVVGYITYRQTRNKLEEDLKKSVRDNLNRILGNIYYDLSFHHWREYENMLRTDLRYDALVNLAIEEAKNAMASYEALDNKKYESRIAYYRMTLAYNLAVRNLPDDKDETLRIAKGNWMRAAKFSPTEEHNIRETLAYVILKFSDKPEERKEAMEEVENLMKWARIPKLWKDKMKEKYSKEFGVSLNPGP